MKMYLRIIMLQAIVALVLPVIAMADYNTLVSDDGEVIEPTQLHAEASLESILGISFPFKGNENEMTNEGADITPLTDEEIETIRALPSLSGESKDKKEVIIGADSRMQVYTTMYPTRTTALIGSSAGQCTGWFIGKDTVVTAGHCVHSGGTGGKWYSNFKIYPGYTGIKAPYGYCSAKKAYSTDGWTSNKNDNYDYGILKLNCTVGDKVGWFGFQNLSSVASVPTIINGYPGDKPKTQWVSADRVRSYTSYRISYKNDTYGGMSGSPVWYEAGSGPYCIGIHTLGSSSINSGTRINTSVFNNLKTIKDQ